MNRVTAVHPIYIYIGVAFVAFAPFSVAVTQETGVEPTVESAAAAADTDIVNDEPEENRRENQVQTGTPVTAIGIKSDTDSGANDNITNHTSPVIEFTRVLNGAITARYRKSGSSSWTTATSVAITNGSTYGTVTLRNLTADGDYEVEITQTVLTVPAKATYTFTLDTAAPAVNTAQSRPFSPRTPIKISDGGDVSVSLQNDKFGSATAISADGTLLAIGANFDSFFRGAVYLFEKSNGTWSQTLKISDNNGGTGELDVSLNIFNQFGSATALSANGTLLAVGARGDSSLKGAVYLFEKSGGTWSQTLKIFDKPTAAGVGELDIPLINSDSFGTATALSADGTILAVGASGTSSNKGAVYLFEKSNGVWSQSLKISDNNGGANELDISLGPNDYFGSATSLSADGTLLSVGASGDSSKGAVYLFEKSNGVWSQSLKISDNNGGANELDISLGPNDNFGIATALSAGGNILAVSASGTSSNKGAVYLFEKDGLWSRTVKIHDNGSGTGEFNVSLTGNDHFGIATALSADGNILAVGASGTSSNKGAVYLFEYLSDSGSARSVTISATDNDQSSTWEYTTITDDTCGAAQFATTQTAYTEGSNITFSSESDTGKFVCFKTTDAAGNATVIHTFKTPSEPLTAPHRHSPPHASAPATAAHTASARRMSPRRHRQNQGQHRLLCLHHRHRNHRRRLERLHRRRDRRHRTRHQRQVRHHHRRCGKHREGTPLG